ncbi:MAG TPA: OB-fold domain-containing protein [Candidatus Eisenbacteria bacterium]|nr:OB-fold domain-containing protein [Candidatus Eisenbacteria bacterium]
MVGITRLGTYFPRRRLDRALIAKAWGGRASGTRTVAGVDEDALTMAVESAMECLGDTGASDLDGVYFASTSAPYLEKQVASVVATALDCRRDVAVADFTGSVRGGIGAVRAACDAVAAGSLRSVLVATADTRLAEPESELEALFGDGAAAAVVGREQVIAELVAMASVGEEFTHFYRTDAQRYVQVADARFGTTYGFAAVVPEAVAAALRKAGIEAGKIAKLVLAAPDVRAAQDVAKRVGCDAARLVAPLVAEAGVLGTPDPLVLLSRALETAKAGDVLVVAGYGEGADALVFRATDALASARPRTLEARLARPLAMASYEKYLKARNVIPVDYQGEPFPTYLEWKELKQDIRLYGSRCEACGLVQYPMAHVCLGCKARERLVDHKLGRRGAVFTYTIDNLAPVAEHPMPMLVIDLAGGGRIYLQGTDSAEGEIDVGTPVALTFRRLHESGGNRNYYWKARPA